MMTHSHSKKVEVDREGEGERSGRAGERETGEMEGTKSREERPESTNGIK